MIRGKKVMLRTFKQDDLDAYLKVISDLSNMNPYWPAHLRSEVSLRREFGENGFWKADYKLMLITDMEGNLVGELDNFATSPNIQGTEVGYHIFKREDMGKGYMTEALQLFSAYLYATQPTMLRLTLLIRSDNAGSKRVAEKCGFVHEGTLRNAWLDDGRPYTMDVYSLLRDECTKLPDLIRKS